MCVTEVGARVHVSRVRSEYNIEVWREVRQRWMVLGVLGAVAAAVVAPRAGAQGGCLRAQYARYLPLGYIYWAAGRRGAWRGAAGAGGRTRLVLVSCAHAALVGPALAVSLLAGAARSDVHHTLVQGVVMSSVGGGCGWLSLALCAEAAAAPLTAAVHLVSLLTAPLTLMLFCGRGVVWGEGAAWGAGAAALAAWGAGAARSCRPGAGEGAARRLRGARLCALALLYMQCCDALALRGSVRLGDLLAVLLLEVCWLAMSGGACWGYARCGLLEPWHARTLALCALPKGAQLGWQWYSPCGGSALVRLPAVLLAPAQALMLAALAPSAPPPPPPQRDPPSATPPQ